MGARKECGRREGSAWSRAVRAVHTTSQPWRVQGLTLLEILAALGILATLLVLAAPGYQDIVARIEVETAARALASTLNRARTEAIKHGYRVNVCKSADGRQCTDVGQWEVGYLAYRDDDDGDGAVDPAGSRIRSEGPAGRGITIHGNRPVANYVSFTALGHARLLNGALQMGTFTVCRAGQKAYDVVFANSGRVRIDRTSHPCP